MIKESYTVKYRVEGVGSSTNGSATIMLYSDNESEAIAALKSRGTIGRDKEVVILSITPSIIGILVLRFSLPEEV